jgi:hypothetical protein
MIALAYLRISGETSGDLALLAVGLGVQLGVDVEVVRSDLRWSRDCGTLLFRSRSEEAASSSAL